jgi:hypothetical protein
MTTKTTGSTGASFSGWLRSAGGQWRKVVQADTLEAAWGALLSHPSESAHSERVVLRSGVSPERKRQRRMF